jgi:hypothetical protein
VQTGNRSQGATLLSRVPRPSFAWAGIFCEQPALTFHSCHPEVAEAEGRALSGAEGCHKARKIPYPRRKAQTLCVPFLASFARSG